MLSAVHKILYQFRESFSKLHSTFVRTFTCLSQIVKTIGPVFIVVPIKSDIQAISGFLQSLPDPREAMELMEPRPSHIIITAISAASKNKNALDSKISAIANSCITWKYNSPRLSSLHSWALPLLARPPRPLKREQTASPTGNMSSPANPSSSLVLETLGIVAVYWVALLPMVLGVKLWVLDKLELALYRMYSIVELTFDQKPTLRPGLSDGGNVGMSGREIWKAWKCVCAREIALCDGFLVISTKIVSRYKESGNKSMGGLLKKDTVISSKIQGDRYQTYWWKWSFLCRKDTRTRGERMPQKMLEEPPQCPFFFSFLFHLWHFVACSPSSFNSSGSLSNCRISSRGMYLVWWIWFCVGSAVGCKQGLA